MIFVNKRINIMVEHGLLVYKRYRKYLTMRILFLIRILKKEFLFVDFFDTIETLIIVTSRVEMLNKEGNILI